MYSMGISPQQVRTLPITDSITRLPVTITIYYFFVTHGKLCCSFMIFLNSAFSLFIGIHSLPGIWAAFPEEVETQLAIIDRTFRDFLEQADITYLALPFSRIITEEKNQSVSEVINQVEDSMSNIRALITEEDPQFSSVLTRLSDVLNRNLRHAASNVENREEALRKARANLEFFEERMGGLENTDLMYGVYLYMRCGVIDFMSSLGGANSVWNESSEALELLNRDVDLRLNERFFDGIHAFITGKKINLPSSNSLFAVNSVWKIRRVGTQPAVGHFDPSLPSWSAFYSLEGPQKPPARLESILAADNGMTLERRYPDSGDLHLVYKRGIQYETIYRAFVRETSRDEALTCAICLEDMEEVESRLAPCLHGFHRSCVEQLLSNYGNCPVCRRPFSFVLV